MNKVLIISLNGNAYQLEEAAYDMLRAYLETAHAKLAGNPDLDEIMRDLEQAIGEKLHSYMSEHKSVANESDVEKVLAEMGPVDAVGEKSESDATAAVAPKRLYRLRDQGVISGVCAGVAAYFNIDVAIVRLAALVLVLITGGAFILAYFVAIIIIPIAETSDERHAAYGEIPITAQRIIDEAMNGYHAAVGEYQKWNHKSRAEKRAIKRQWKQKLRSAWHYEGAAWQNYHHNRHSSLIGEVVQVVLLGLGMYLLYTYVPQTQPFFDHLLQLIQQGWSWIFAKLGAVGH